MAKFEQRLEAKQLRAKGTSVRDIALQLGVSKSTASIWVRDIILSLEQLEKLRQQKIIGGEKGRVLGALKQKNDRLARIKLGIERGKQLIQTLSEREFLLAGIALYWAEGSKKQRRVEFCNSDPKLVQFMIAWLEKCFYTAKADFYCWVGINEIHREREQVVKNYWSKITGIPLSQFRKTSFKKVHNKKIYENFDIHYGTLSVQVRRPAQIYYDILGLIEGLANAMPE